MSKLTKTLRIYLVDIKHKLRGILTEFMFCMKILFMVTAGMIAVAIFMGLLIGFFGSIVYLLHAEEFELMSTETPYKFYTRGILFGTMYMLITLLHIIPVLLFDDIIITYRYITMIVSSIMVFVFSPSTLVTIFDNVFVDNSIKYFSEKCIMMGTISAIIVPITELVIYFFIDQLTKIVTIYRNIDTNIVDNSFGEESDEEYRMIRDANKLD